MKNKYIIRVVRIARGVCTAVVNGLTNFQVGFPTSFPTEGSSVDSSSYDVCGTYDGVVSVGLEINFDCSTLQRYRYVIVQSLDTIAERLCIGEVGVFELCEYAVRCAVTVYFTAM